MGSVIVLLQDKNQTRVEHVSYAMLMAVPAALRAIPTLASDAKTVRPISPMASAFAPHKTKSLMRMAYVQLQLNSPKPEGKRKKKKLTKRPSSRKDCNQ